MPARLAAAIAVVVWLSIPIVLWLNRSVVGWTWTSLIFLGAALGIAGLFGRQERDLAFGAVALCLAIPLFVALMALVFAGGIGPEN